MKFQSATYILIFLISFTWSKKTSAQDVKIQVFPELKKQKIISIGGNYCQANYTNHAWDKIGEATLREFRPSHVRVALPLKLRGIAFETYKGENFTRQKLVIEVLETLKRMKEEFGVKNFTISVWDVPDEWIDVPARTAQRVIKPGAYDEVITTLTGFFLKAKNEYGVEIDNFSFNESDGGYQIIFSPQETINFIKKAGQKFKVAGLKTRFLWADTAQTLGTVEFATQIMADSSIWKYIGPLSFHSWWSEKISDSEFERIAGFGKAWKKEIWCGELGFDAMAWKIKDMNKSWDYALRFARIWHRMMKYAEVEVSLYWTWQNNYEIMSADTNEKYPSFFMTQHQVKFFNRNTQIIHSISSDPEILPFCGIQPDGRKVIQIINMKKVPVNIKVSGLDGKCIEAVSTTENSFWEIHKKFPSSKNGLTPIQLKPESVNTYIFNL